jgi:hypothetical protein
MSAGSAVGKIIYGRMSDYFQSRTQTIYVISMFTSGLCSILFSFLSTSYTGLVFYVTVFGLLDGSFIGLMSVMAFKCTGSIELMSCSWGLSLMFMSCSMIVGPPTVGKCQRYHQHIIQSTFLKTGKDVISRLIPNLIPIPLLSGWLKEAGIPYRCLFYLTGGPMILGALILAPTIFMDSGDTFQDNSLVLMNEPVLPEHEGKRHRIEIQKLTVL